MFISLEELTLVEWIVGGVGLLVLVFALCRLLGAIFEGETKNDFPRFDMRTYKQR